MSSGHLRRAEELYFALAAIPQSDRSRVLDEACAGDGPLRQEVLTLLEHAEALDGFLEEPALGADFKLLVTPQQSPGFDDDLVGATLSPYKIEERIAAGGMGVVYRAVRIDQQFKQRVAIKVVKRGMDSEEILHRFRQERQTLAALDHPSIARLIDGGATPDGRPYLVMEYVEGLPIDQYCDLHRMATIDRLRLFKQVCDAVQCAHQHLIVHRDLKPGNILVTREGTPKLLDFGIAKVISAERAIDLTQPTDLRLTPEYASPEQIRGHSTTTATDVYALGVILYELLTGFRPYVFDTRTMVEIERIICSFDPPAPSIAVTRTQTRAGIDGKATTRITPELASQTREGTPARLRKRLHGDLDNIILMALKKDSIRRYPSAEALAADITRYLEGMPVRALKDTLAYRARKFFRRHAVAVTLSGLVALGTVGGAIALAVQAGNIAEQRNEAYAARDEAEAIAKFLETILNPVDLSVPGPDATVRMVLDAAAVKLDEVSDPKTRAAIESAIGRTYVSLGEYALAEQHLRAAFDLRSRALGADHHDVAESKMDLAALYHATSRAAEAEALLVEALDTHRRLRGEVNLDTARVYNDLGSVLRGKGEFDRAGQMHRTALQIRTQLSGPDSLEVAESLNNLAGILRAQNDLQGAEDAATNALRIRKSQLKPNHPLIIQSTQNLGTMIASRGEYERAEPYLREALAAARDTYPDGHPSTAFTLATLGNLLTMQHKAAEAEPLLREALEIRRARLRPGDPTIIATEVNLGRALLQIGNAEGAEMLTLALAKLKRPDGSLDARWQAAAADLADFLEAVGKPEEAATWRKLGKS